MATRREKEKKQKKYADARRRDAKHGGDWTPTSYKVPEGMERFRWKEPKKYRIDAIPYTVGKGKHPENSGGPNPYADEGELYYERTFWIHQGIGSNQRAQYCCPAKNWGERCPICEYCDKNRDQKGLFKAMGFKTRQLWLFIDRDAKDKGIQIFESAYKMSFGEQIHEFRLAADNDDPCLNFWHTEDGMTLAVKIKADSWEGRKTMKVSRIDFVPRKNPLEYDESKIPCLDDLLIKKTYKELEEMLKATGTPSDDDSQDSSSDASSDDSQDSDASSDAGSDDSQASDASSDDSAASSSDASSDVSSDAGSDDSQASGDSSAEAKGIEEGTTVEHKKLGLCEVVHVSGDGTSLKLKDKKGKVHSAIDPDDCEIPNALNHFEDEKEEKAKAKKKAKEESQDSDASSDAGSDDSDAGSGDSDADSDAGSDADSDAVSSFDSVDSDAGSDASSDDAPPAKKPAAKKPAAKAPAKKPAPKKPGKK